MKYIITLLLVLTSIYCLGQKIKTGVEVQKDLYDELYSKVGKTINLPLFKENGTEFKQVKSSITLKVDSIHYWYYGKDGLVRYGTQNTNTNMNGYIYRGYFHNPKPIRKFIKKIVDKNTQFEYDRNNIHIYHNAMLTNTKTKYVAVIHKNTVTIVRIKKE